MPRSPIRSPLAIALFVGAAVLGLATDLGTKWLAFDSAWKLADHVEQIDGRCQATAGSQPLHLLGHVKLKQLR